MGTMPDPASEKNWLDRLGQVFSSEPKDREELVAILREAHERNLFDTSALAMIEGVFQVSELQVRDIMIPRSHMVVVEEEHSVQEMLPTIIESAHSRFPVIGDSRDEVVGVLLAKDLLRFLSDKNTEEFNIKDILRSAFIVPESKRLNILLNEFRNTRNHMAIIVDEYGGVSGLVTIEDVLEQIVGDITDEHDLEEDQYITYSEDDKYALVKALTPIEDFNEFFDCSFKDDEFDTIGGLVTSNFGHVPKRSEDVSIDEFKFEVISADSRRLHLLKVTRL
ncbi:MAG: transporter associated domain-containing protein [Gammaproteobacteria bacterium]|nr:transporter associated domain-containing protein [Gammaproteobacteria bacterium]